MIFLIDFGLSKRYISPCTGSHIPFQMKNGCVGTLKFLSQGTHNGQEHSRRDDLEGLGNILIYLANQGKLPWSQHKFPGDFVLKADMKANAEELHIQKIKKYEAKMKHLKTKTTLEFLCQGLPPQFLDYMNYCRRLGFEENPDYNYLKNLFTSFMKELDYEDDGQYDWVIQRVKIEEKIKRDEEIQKNMAALKSMKQTNASSKGYNQKMLAQLEEEQRKQAEEELNK